MHCYHLTQERGLQLSGKFDIDEETKYSSVCPVNGFDDSGYEEEKEILLDCRNNMTFGDSNPNRNESQLAEQRNGKSLESSHYKKVINVISFDALHLKFIMLHDL